MFAGWRSEQGSATVVRGNYRLGSKFAVVYAGVFAVRCFDPRYAAREAERLGDTIGHTTSHERPATAIANDSALVG